MGLEARVKLNKTATASDRKWLNKELSSNYNQKISSLKAGYTAETHEFSEDFLFVMNFVVEKLRAIAVIDEEKIPELSEIFIHSRKDFRLIKNDQGIPTEAMAFCLPWLGLIYLDASLGSTELVNCFIHELIHVLCETTMMIRHDKGNFKYLSQSGLEAIEHEKFLLLNEAITEMMACDLANILHAEMGEGYNFTDDYVGYGNLTIAMGIFLVELSRREGISFVDLRQQFYKAMLSGDIGFLRIITKHFGAGVLKEIANLKMEQFDSIYKSQAFLNKLDIESSLLERPSAFPRRIAPRDFFNTIESGLVPKPVKYSPVDTSRMPRSSRLRDPYWSIGFTAMNREPRRPSRRDG
jgi:hypothetical protein